MSWFDADAIEFFRELELNNEKPWFEANKKRYETAVKAPLERFTARLIELYREFEPDLGDLQPKNCVFRIYKDVRFSKDKTPYKTSAGTLVSKGGRQGKGSPGIYFHFDRRRLGVATGYYELEPERLAVFRRHIASNLDEFQKLLDERKFKTYFGGIAGEKNKVLPPEFREAAAKQPFLFNKQFYYWSENEPETLLRPDLDEFVIERFRAAGPMNAFLAKA
jgi:uncharacterized protein (TIGR02453 family)